MKFKTKFLILIILFSSINLFANNISITDTNIKNLNNKVNYYKNLIKKVFNFKLNTQLNNISYNYNPYIYEFKPEISKNYNNLKKQKQKNYIIKIIPKILLNNKVYIKYIKIDNLKNRFETTLWVKPGDKFDNCKFIKIYHTTKLLFKCDRKYIRTEFLPKIKFN